MNVIEEDKGMIATRVKDAWQKNWRIACSRNGRNEARMSCCNRGSDKVYTHTHTHAYIYTLRGEEENEK